MKAEHVNRLIIEYSVDSVVELGCGDGYQASLLVVNRYTGLDIAPTAVKLCRDRFLRDHTKAFKLYTPGSMPPLDLLQADMSLSLGVIFHLVEQQIFEQYMMDLFRLGRRLVVIYSTNGEFADLEPRYTKRRVFTDWIRDNMPAWVLAAEYPIWYSELSRCAFWVYVRPISGS